MAATMDDMSRETDEVSIVELNSSALDGVPYDIYTGANTGFLKGCSYSNNVVRNLNKIPVPDKNLEVTCLTWGPNESTVYAGSKNGCVACYNLPSKSGRKIPVGIPESRPSLKKLKCHDNTLITAFSNGSIRINKFDTFPWTKTFEELKNQVSETEVEIVTGKDLHCMELNTWTPNFLATGGKENPLKLWDITGGGNAPIFTAKNVKNDWLNLRVPIWDTVVQFCAEGKKIVTGTGHSQIRLYDPFSKQRRPIMEMKFEDAPITTLDIRPNSDFHILVGNTLGSIALLDLRKSGILKSFKGCRGGITDVKFHSSEPLFVCCSVDRFVYFYNAEKKSPLQSTFTNSSLNCLLLSSQFSLDGTRSSTHIEKASSENEVSQKRKGEKEKIEEEDVDNVWDEMEVVQTKKRKKVISVPKPKKKKST